MGCGSGSSSPPRSSIHEIEDWVAQLEHSDAHLDFNDFSRDELHPPPVRLPAFSRLKIAATFAGDKVSEASDKLAEATDLDEDQQDALGCYLIQKAIAGEISFDLLSLEKLLLGFLADRFVEPVPAFRFRLEVNDLGEALDGATSEGRKVADLTMATICAYQDE